MIMFSDGSKVTSGGIFTSVESTRLSDKTVDRIVKTCLPHGTLKGKSTPRTVYARVM